jgi:hypothetical protein
MGKNSGSEYSRIMMSEVLSMPNCDFDNPTRIFIAFRSQ